MPLISAGAMYVAAMTIGKPDVRSLGLLAAGVLHLMPVAAWAVEYRTGTLRSARLLAYLCLLGATMFWPVAILGRFSFPLYPRYSLAVALWGTLSLFVAVPVGILSLVGTQPSLRSGRATPFLLSLFTMIESFALSASR